MDPAATNGPTPIPATDQDATRTFAERPTSAEETLAYASASSKERVPIVPGFTILGKLGEGGMGTVWRAHQISTKRDVALKLMRSAAFGSEKNRLRFEREVEISAQFQHPNIAQVYESGEIPGAYYYALQLVNGVPLDLFVRKHQCDTPAILRLMLKVCAAVQHAHQRGVIHRDLKPGNILVDELGEPFVLDFGLAKTTLAENADHDAETLTQEGMIVGTPAYMAPEQAAGKVHELDTRTDVYSLGVILYRLLTGELPHARTGTQFELLRRIVDEEVRRPRSVNNRLHWELEAILLKALAKAPADRYSFAAELAADLNNHLTGEPITAHAPSLWYFVGKRLRKHAMAAALASMVLASVLAGVIFYIVAIQNERDNTKLQFARAETNADIADKNAKAAIVSANDAELRRQDAATQRDVAVKALDREARQTYWTTVRLADDLIKRGEFGEGLRRLWDTPKALRGWEWGYLVAHCPMPDNTLQAHAGRVLGLAVSPDRKQLVTCGEDGKVAAWDIATMKPRWRYDGSATAGCLACSPGGKQIAVGVGADIIILEASTGNVVHAVRNKAGIGFVQLQFHSDGNRLLTCLEYSDRKNKYEYGMLDTNTWSKLPIKLDADHANGAFDAGGKYFLSGGLNRASALDWYDPQSFKRIEQVKLTEKAFVQVKDVVLDTRRDTLILLEVFDAKFVKLSDRTIVARGKFETRTKNRIIAAAPDWDANQVGMVTATGEVRVCDLQGNLLAAADHADAVTGITSLGGGRFVTGGRQGRIKIWDVEHMQAAVPIVGHSPRWTNFHGRSLALSADGKKIACQSSISRSFGLGNLNDTTPWTVIQTNFGNHFQFLGFTSTDEMVVCHTITTKDAKPSVASWICRYAADGRADPLLRAVRSDAVIRSSQMDALGRRLILAVEPGEVEIRELDSWKLLPTVVTEKPQVVAISPDGTRAAALNNDGTELTAWDVDSGHVLVRVKCRIARAVNGLFHHNGEYLAIGDRDGGVTLFAITPAKSEPLAFLQEHTGEITGMKFSRDGNRLFTSGADHSIRVWDWRLGRDLLILTNGKYDYFDVTFTNDGRTLAATSHAPKIQLHHALPWEFDETAPEFGAAVADGQLRAKARRLVDQTAAMTKSTPEIVAKLKANPNIDAVTRQAAIDSVLHRAIREEKLIVINTLMPR